MLSRLGIMRGTRGGLTGHCRRKMRGVETGTGFEVAVRWLRLTERLFRYSDMQRLNIVGIALTFGVLRAVLRRRSASPPPLTAFSLLVSTQPHKTNMLCKNESNGVTPSVALVIFSIFQSNRRDDHSLELSGSCQNRRGRLIKAMAVCSQRSVLRICQGSH